MKKLSIILFASTVIVLSSCKAKEEAPAEKVSLEEGIKEMQDLNLDSNNVVAPIADTTKK